MLLQDDFKLVSAAWLLDCTDIGPYACAQYCKGMYTWQDEDAIPADLLSEGATDAMQLSAMQCLVAKCMIETGRQKLTIPL